MSSGIILRPRQRVFVDRCLAALEQHGQTLAVAPTGMGKTICLSAVAGHHGGRALVLQHREELVRQNRDTYRAVNPGASTAVYARWGKQWCEGATFAMVPTLSRANHLAGMPRVDLVVVDEAHHSTAKTYRRILDRARELNPAVHVLGVTATPNRGDKGRLTDIFTNLADQVTLGELIGAGHLVEPRAFVMDVGLNSQLGEVRRTLRGRGEYDLDAAAELLDVTPVTERVIEEWRDKAGDRQTVVFCGTVDHATHVADAFIADGISAGLVTGETPPDDRARILRAVDSGDIQVLVNVAVATEGWDSPPISCVVLLRPSSYHSTMVQMIGRGLRTVDPQKFPGVRKHDCIVLDFGRSLLTHGGLEQVVDLRPHADTEGAGGLAPKKRCEECGAMVALATRQCPLCGYQWPVQLTEATTIREFRMVELDLLLSRSPYRWWRMNERCRVVSSIDAWAVVFEISNTWHAFVGHEGRVEHTATGSENMCVSSAEDWMRVRGNTGVGGKDARWMDEPVSDKQREQIARWSRPPVVANRYEASCAMTLKFNKRHIARLLEAGAQERAA